MRRNGSNGKNPKDDSDTARISAYVTKEQKREWLEQRRQDAEIDDIRNPDNGTFLARAIKYKLRFDLASIAAYVKTHKRRRDQTPARN